MTTRQIQLIKYLLTAPESHIKELEKTYGVKRVSDYLDKTYQKCGLPMNFVSIHLAGCGGFGATWSFCIDSKCTPKLLLKIIPYKFYGRVRFNPQDPTRPENVEIKTLNKLYDLFESHSKTFPQHIPVPYASFICNKQTNSIFRKFLTGLHRKYPNLKCSNLFSSEFYRLTIVEYAELKDLHSYLYTIRSEYSFKVVIFQILMALTFLNHHLPNFRHNDLHCGNILIKKRKAPLVYKIFNKTWIIKDPKVQVLINDFDFATNTGARNLKVDTFCNLDKRPYSDVHFICYDILRYNHTKHISIPYVVIDFLEMVVPKFLQAKRIKHILSLKSTQKKFNPKFYQAKYLIIKSWFNEFVQGKLPEPDNLELISIAEGISDLVCDKWNAKKTINPLTKKVMAVNGAPYKRFQKIHEKFCE